MNPSRRARNGIAAASPEGLARDLHAAAAVIGLGLDPDRPDPVAR